MNSPSIKKQQFRVLEQKICQFPELWKQEDVAKWLEFIGMSGYIQNFKEMEVDGLIILDIDENDLEHDLKIVKKLHRKKILKGVEILKEFQDYLLAKGETQSQIQKEKLKNSNFLQEDEESFVAEEQLTTGNEHNTTFISQENQLIQEEKINSNFEQKKNLILQSVDGQNEFQLVIRDEELSLGRHSSNQVVVSDETVSRNHAKIFNEDQSYYLQDVGSTTGTFLKTKDPLPLFEGIVLEIGSYQFKVTEIHIENNETNSNEMSQPYLQLNIIESPDDIEDLIYQIKCGECIGRKSNNTLSFPHDMHMSNLHGKFNFIQGRFFYEDLQSTNGSWMRLSDEGQKSELFLLEEDSVFKIGNAAMYQVGFEKPKIKQIIEQ